MPTNTARRLLPIILAVVLVWLFTPVPEDLAPNAWHLAFIFAATILTVLTSALPIFTAAIIALAVSVISGVLPPDKAFSGFGEDFILLIVAAFLVARGVINSGLGNRIAWFMISKIGHSTLGLAYSILAVDFAIAAAFPSNTARSGVLYPIAESLSLGLDSKPEPASRKRVGAYLMMIGIVSLSLSSTLWLTAMAANPVGVAIARSYGIDINFGTWLLASSVPCLIAGLVLPLIIYKVFPPELHKTPEAPANASKALAEMGPISRPELVTAMTFVAMVALWALADTLDINATAVAFAGLGALMLAGVFTIEDLHKEGPTLEVFVWFAILFAISTALNELGFMVWLGSHISALVTGLTWQAALVALVLAYILIHYFFVSQSAHLLALFPVFLGVGIEAGVPGLLMALSLLFATNYFSAQTPQAS